MKTISHTFCFYINFKIDLLKFIILCLNHTCKVVLFNCAIWVYLCIINWYRHIPTSSMGKKVLIKLELLSGAITRIAPCLCTGARYSPKCELALFHWKQSCTCQEPKGPEVYVKVVCSLFLKAMVVAPWSPLEWPGVQWDTICFALPHKCLCGISLWKGEGQVAWKMAAGVSIRSNYCLHCLGSFPSF